MRSNKTFYFFLTDSAGRSLYWDEGTKTVGRQTLARPINFAPDGWMDTQLAFGRSTRYYGINRSFTTPYKFVEDGALIIRALLYTGMCYEENIYLVINKWNEGNDVYEGYYKGQLDLLKIVDDSPTGITVNLIEGGFLKLLNANDETAFEIPLDGPYTKYIEMDGIALSYSQPYQLIALDEGFITGPGIGNYGLNQFLGFAQLSGDSRTDFLIFNSPVFGEVPGGTFYDYSDWIVRVADNFPSPIPVRIRGSFTNKLLEQPNIGTAVYQWRWDIATDTANIDTGQIPSTNGYNPNYTIGETKTIEFDFILTLQPGEKLFLTGRGFSGVPNNGFLAKWVFTSNRIEINPSVTVESTVIKAISPFDLCNELLKKVTGSTAYTLNSNLLNQYGHLLLTSGDGIRGLAGAVIKTTFNEFFNNFNKILFAGFGNTGMQMFFERRTTFYDASTNTMDVGEVSELQVSLAEQELANTVKVGYPNQDYTDVNGRAEFNTTFKFQLPVVNAGKREIDLVSSYRADGYGIEYTRINLEGKKTTDSDSDNATFIINTEGSFPSQLTAERAVEAEQGANTPVAFVSVDEDIPGLIEANDTRTAFTYRGYAWPSATIVFSFDADTSVTGQVLVNGVVVGSVTGSGSQTVTVGDVSLAAGDVITTNMTGAATLASASLVLSANNFTRIRREAYTSITGVLTDTVFNIEDLTPKRMLLKHAPYLRSLLYFQTLQRITFLTADKNRELATLLDEVFIDEDAGVRVDTLGVPMFYPYIFSFKTRVPINFTQLLSGAVNGHIKFSFNGHTLYGFPVQVSVKPSLNDSQDWKLLASPVNDLSQLINITDDVIDINALGMYALSFSHLSPVQFVPIGVTAQPAYHFTHMDSGFFKEQIERYSQPGCYFQKWETTDIINLQCMTRLLGPVNVHMYRGDGLFIGTFSLQQTPTPSVQLPMIMFQGSINLNTIPLRDDYYQLICVAGDVETNLVFKSEWMHIKAEWPETMLIEYYHNRNKQNMVFSTTYRPQMRLECMIDDYLPKTKLAMYEDQTADAYMLDGIAYRQFNLWVGDDRGVAPYVTDKLNRIFNLTNVLIDGKGFTREVGEDFEKVQRYDGVPTAFWRLALREARNLDGTTLSSDGLLNVSAVLLNVDTMLFGDLTSQVSSNPVQIEVYEPG